jgi:hypothetical protein
MLPKAHRVICITLKLRCGFNQAYHFEFDIPIKDIGICLRVISSLDAALLLGLDTFLSFDLAVFFVFVLFQGLIHL